MQQQKDILVIIQFIDMAKQHYIDNKTLLTSLLDYKKQVRKAKRLKINKPRIPNYVGECFMMIATRLATKPNFVNYTYKDEMISDGVENCIVYIDNFDPEKSSNPFAYFTQIIFFAFLRRIQKEKKQLYIKHKTMEKMMLFDEDLQQGEDYRDIGENPSLYNEKMNEMVKSFEENLIKKKTKRKKDIQNEIE